MSPHAPELPQVATGAGVKTGVKTGGGVEMVLGHMMHGAVVVVHCDPQPASASGLLW
jgi:hypothetical protein